jgi:hypothetical protein
MQQCKAAAIGKDDNQIHYDECQVVVPAIGFLSPETGVPHEDLFIDCAQHDQDQAQGGGLSQNTEHDSQAAQHFAGSDQDGEVLAQTNALAASFRIFEVVPAAGDEDDSDHPPEQKKSKIGELRELGEHGYAAC